MKKILIAKLIILIILVLSFQSISGCISPEFQPNPIVSNKHPNNPQIAIKSNDSVRITWSIYDSGEYFIKYAGINPEKKTINEKRIYNRQFFISKLIRDSEDYIYFFSCLSGNIKYIKMDDYGSILFDKEIPNSSYQADTLDTSKRFDVTIDKRNNFHLIWINTNLSASYALINNNGTIVSSKYLNDFIKNIPILYHSLNIELDLQIDQNLTLHCIWQNGYRNINSVDYKISDYLKNIKGNSINVDNFGNLYILNDKNIIKANNNGTIIFEEHISNISIIPGYAVIKGDDEKYIYLKDNGGIDSENNLHVVTQKIESKVWESGRYLKEYDFYTIYYSKIAPNGTKLIDNMIIDTDGEPSWETGEYGNQLMLTSLIIAIPAVIIILIFMKFFIFKNKKKEGNIKEQQKRF